MVTPPRFSLDALTAVVWEAGQEILRHYAGSHTVVAKADGSPLTSADRAAHLLLTQELPKILAIPVLSEESEEIEVASRRDWPLHWLVDPLDGTKEFLSRSGEFTVNVALVGGGRPMVGVVHAPALRRSYRASPESGAEAAEGEDSFRSIRTRTFRRDRPVLVASRDHAGPGVRALAEVLGDAVSFASMGSSLKFCLVAEGRADLYLRDLPTMEWDTGAAQCVVEAAGGAVIALGGSRASHPLEYEKESLKNPPFLALGDPDGPWRELLGRAGLTD
ncbi:MAG: 3'(2'),5'-bisphosphate nucleotidase CysQ [Gemmatimonadota bacterium]